MATEITLRERLDAAERSALEHAEWIADFVRECDRARAVNGGRVYAGEVELAESIADELRKLRDHLNYTVEPVEDAPVAPPTADFPRPRGVEGTS